MLTRFIPMLGWLAAYRRQDLRSDAAAGLTTAVMIIPQAMGYAMLAGLPPIVGLYAALAPVLAYACLGTSRQLSVGPVAMDSLLVAVAVGAIAEAGSTHYVAVAGTLGVMVSGMAILCASASSRRDFWLASLFSARRTMKPAMRFFSWSATNWLMALASLARRASVVRVKATSSGRPP